MKSLDDFTVAIVGLGLMGGSLALALRERGACRRIVGITRDPETRRAALARGVVDAAGAELALAEAADAIVLATPVRTVLGQMEAVGRVARAGTVVMDLGSTKREVTRAMEGLPEHLEPLGGHPMCGRETAGFAAADAELYKGAVFVLTPLARTAPETVAFGRSLVEAVGARPLIMDPARHDRIVAAISHLPFTVATSLMATTEELARGEELLYTLASSGFRDTSRVAAKETTVMLDILMTNRENVAAAARACAGKLGELARLIEAGDEPALRARLEVAAASRRGLFRQRRADG